MLVDALLESADRRPGQVAVADPFVELTYANLVRLADVMRRHVEATTSCPRIGIMLPSSVGFVATYLGALWARRVVVSLNFLLQPAELAAVVADAGIDTIYAVKPFETMVSPLPVRAVYLEDLPLKRAMVLERLRRKPPAPRVAPDETAVMLYTSGTTGVPKGVCLSYANLSTNADDCIAMARLQADHRFLGVLPLFHSFGQIGRAHV
jgi:acyl-CoA synthetase (AMP-forming)/AMP-acid ligase II